MNEGTTQQYEPNVLNRYGKNPSQISEIVEHPTGALQISLEGGRIFIDAEISSTSMGIKPFLKIRFVDDSTSHPGN